MKTMTDGNKTNTPEGFELDSFFAAARDEEPMPSGDFMARIEADALSALPEPTRVSTSRPGLWQQLLQAIGGVPGAAGLAAACATGVWIGVAPPETLTEYWEQSAESEWYELDPNSGFDFAMLEG
ncbi:hypothetical protein [uncultured Pelagimonas sp.]|uniref:hypothetical protein n=1 Tax=uncultured Pelagimonas sp. TaxID=1618102 RepID=UPI0026257F2F|nr:hypothetical protein [uncultured Pelagimonas sp.]